MPSPNWTEQQVKNLNDYQTSGVFHPYTCGGNRNGKSCRADLVATKDGWVCPEGCGYTQEWADASTLNFNIEECKHPFLKRNKNES